MRVSVCLNAGPHGAALPSPDYTADVDRASEKSFFAVRPRRCVAVTVSTVSPPSKEVRERGKIE